MTDPNELLSQAIVQLFEKERFYAEILLNMDRQLSKRIPTAGVRIKQKVELVVNPDFFQSLTPETRVAILKHECEHILRDHISRAKEIHPEVYHNNSSKGDLEEDIVDDIIKRQKHKIMNIAMDCGINCGINNIPEDGCFPKTFGLKDGETFEWYLENLKNNEKAKGLSNFDDHSIWSESDGDKDEIRQKLKKLVKDAADKARSAGCLTGDQELLVDNMIGSKNNWKNELRRFAAKHLETKLDTSRKKRNRRYGIAQPGHIKLEELHIGVAIDTSGSVSDNALNQFMAEIRKMAKYAKITVVEADSEVKESYVFNPKKQYKIKGRGGTAYQPAFDFFNAEGTIDGLIYFGDMDCFDNEEIKKPIYPVLWAVVGDQKNPVDWGTRIEIPLD